VGALTRLDPIDVGVIRGPPPGLPARRSSGPHNNHLGFVSGRPSPSRQWNLARSRRRVTKAPQRSAYGIVNRWSLRLAERRRSCGQGVAQRCAIGTFGQPQDKTRHPL